MLQEITCPDPRELEQFDVGALADEDAESLERHLAHCSRCVDKLETLHSRDTLIDAMRAQGTLTPRPTAAEPVQSLMHRLKDLCASSFSTTTTALDQTPRPTALLGRHDFGFLAAPREPDEMGRLGAYRVLRVLGSGGMGIVFQAEDSQLHRPVALKVLHPAWAQDPSARRRFVREGQAAAAISHDNLVPIYQVGEDRGVPFLAMQLLCGETLEARWRRVGKLAPADIRRIGREIAEGLAAAHQCGLIHRDIKPANIWLEPCATSQSEATDRVKILDFGLARAAEDDAHLTDPGVFVGTPLWVAPEQADSRVVDCRSDLFSLGSVLYALSTGQPPFQAQTSLGMLRRVCDTTPQPVHDVNPAIPVALSNIIAKLHAKNPEDRYQTAADVAEALRTSDGAAPSRRGPRRPSRRSRLWIIAASITLFIIAGLSVTEGAGITQISRMVASLLGGEGNQATENQLAGADEQPQAATAPIKARVYPAALFTFEERAGAKDYGVKVTDLLFAKLAANPAVVLVERNDLNKLFAEQSLNLSGIVNSSAATRVGQLTGAKILITGSVIKAEKKLHLVARVVGTETSRVLPVWVSGATTDDWTALVDKLASEITDTIAQKADQLVAPPAPINDRIKALNARLKKAARPTLWLNITERHVGQPATDPAAQTELTLFSKGCSFPVIDPNQGAQAMADIIVTGEGISELAARHGNLVSVKARVEVKAVERRTGAVLAVDRQTAVVVDLTEQIAAKAALQEAAATLAERLLPKLVK